MARAEPPLDPSPDEARSSLRRELLNPRYHDANLVQRLLSWIERQINEGIARASDVGPLPTLAAMIVVTLLLVGLGLLVSRARRTARTRTPARAVLTDEVLTGAELRARAEAALAEGHHEDALVDAFRALAVRQVERGRLEDSPGATAHEVAVVLAREYPHQRHRVDSSAALFDLVLYGDRPASREQALDVLDLDLELAALR